MVRSVPQHQFIIFCIPVGLVLGFLMPHLSRCLIGAYFDKKPWGVLNSNNFKTSDQMALWEMSTASKLSARPYKQCRVHC